MFTHVYIHILKLLLLLYVCPWALYQLSGYLGVMPSLGHICCEWFIWLWVLTVKKQKECLTDLYHKVIIRNKWEKRHEWILLVELFLLRGYYFISVCFFLQLDYKPCDGAECGPSLWWFFLCSECLVVTHWLKAMKCQQSLGNCTMT